MHVFIHRCYGAVYVALDCVISRVLCITVSLRSAYDMHNVAGELCAYCTQRDQAAIA